MAVASGAVTWSGSRRGFGKLLEIDHGNGYLTRYAHNDQLLVKAGDGIVAGQEIAKMGVFSTPAVVIDGQIKCVGSVPDKNEILAWLKE